MAYSVEEILMWKYPDDYNLSNIIVDYDSFGNPYISYWAVPEVAEPTISTILGYATDPDFISHINAYYRVNKPDGYKTPMQYLMMLYADLKDGTDTMCDHIGNVENVLYPLSGVSGIAPDVTAPVVNKRLNTASKSEIVSVNSSTNQSISGTNKNSLIFGNVNVDVNNKFSSDTYVCNSSGIYEINAFAKVENIDILSLAFNYEWQMYVTINSNSILVDSYTHGILAALPASLRGTILVSLTEGDTVKLQVQKTNSTSLDVSNAYLNIKKICDE